jgi:hypothetical protein
MVLETLVVSPFNHLTRLVAREDFIIHSRRESFRSYIRRISVRVLNLFQFLIFPLSSSYISSASTDRPCVLFWLRINSNKPMSLLDIW